MSQAINMNLVPICTPIQKENLFFWTSKKMCNECSWRCIWIKCNSFIISQLYASTLHLLNYFTLTATRALAREHLNRLLRDKKNSTLSHFLFTACLISTLQHKCFDLNRSQYIFLWEKNRRNYSRRRILFLALLRIYSLDSEKGIK